MTIKKASEIVASIIQWQFYLQGVTNEKPKDLDSEISLRELLKASDKVKKWNSTKRRKQSNGKKGSISIQLTLDDRLIAGVYTALKFPANRNMVVLINSKGVGVVKLDE